MGIGALTAAAGPAAAALAATGDAASPRRAAGIDVRDHGAAGDGARDDAAAIQAALDEAARDGSIVQIPPGRYRISKTLLLPSGVTVLGSGRTSSVISPVRGSGPTTLLGHRKSSGNPTASDITVADVGLLGDAGTLRGLSLEGLSRSSLSRVKIAGLSRPGAIGLSVSGWRDGGAYRNSADNNYYGLEISDCDVGVRLTKAAGDPATFGPSFQNFYGLRIAGYRTVGFDLVWGEGVTLIATRCTTATNGATHIRLGDDVPTLVAPTTDSSTGVRQVGIEITPGCTSALILNPLGDMGRRSSNRRIVDRGSQTIIVRHPFTSAPRSFLNGPGRRPSDARARRGGARNRCRRRRRDRRR